MSQHSRLNRWVLSLFSFLVIGMIQTNAQKIEHVRFENLGIKDGMSQSTNFNVLQDKLGYIWLSTGDGIDRYDGYSFKKYSHFENDPSSLGAGFVVNIYKNDKGQLIASTMDGQTSFMNKKEGTFTKIENKARKQLLNKLHRTTFPLGFGVPNAVYQAPNSNILWVGSYGLGLQKYDLVTGKQIVFGKQEYLNHPDQDLLDQVILTIAPFGKDKLFVGTGNGIKIFDIQKNKYIYQNLQTTAVFDQNSVYHVEKIEQNLYWLATKHGLYQMVIQNNGPIISPISIPGLELSNANIPSIVYNSSTKEVWAGINGKGVFAIHAKSKTWRELRNTNAQPLDKVGFRKLLIDQVGVIWIGTDLNGLFSYDEGKNKFGLYAKAQTRNPGLGFASSWGSAFDADGNIWIGNRESNQKNIGMIDRKTNQVHLIPIKGDISPEQTYRIKSDAKSNIFITLNTPSGRALYKKLAHEKAFTAVQPPKKDTTFLKKFSSNNGGFYLTKSGDLIKGGAKTLWITDAKGNLKLTEYTQGHFPDTTMFFMRDMQTQESYFITRTDLYRWNEETGAKVKLNSKPIEIYKNPFYSEFGLIDHRYLFMATYGKGIMKYDLKTNQISYIDSRMGMPMNAFYEVIKDKNGMLWSGTNFGIVRLNPKNNQIRVFTPSDGVQGYEFNASSVSVSPKGEIIFVGTEGFNVFNPLEFKDNSNPPTVLVQSVKTNKRVIPIESSKSDESIEFSSKENSISFEYIALNYRNASQNQYAFKLEGYDKDWIQAGTRRFTTYTNLPEGKYVFRVKGSNNDGVWNEEGAAFAFKVLPPWYRTWWAYLAYLLITGYSIRYFVKYRERLQRHKMEERRKNSELKAAQELQKSMLPKEMPKRQDVSIHAYIRASTEVGGDYYDFFEQEDGRLFVVCGDATGHGTTSGMMVSITKAGLNGIDPKAPNKILEQLNKVVKRVDLGVLRMSLNIVQIDKNQIHMASAAMPPMYLYKASTKKVEEIQQLNLPLGGLKNETYDLITRDFDPGDVLVQLSDGIPEAPNKAGEMFDYETLQSLIETHAEKPVEELNRIIIEAVDAWLDGQQNPDDITLLITKKG